MYFNPRSPWGERLTRTHKDNAKNRISIHAPRGGSDDGTEEEANEFAISIHAPRGGSDVFVTLFVEMAVTFQSTLPVGGATRSNAQHWVQQADFNPRSPWGERPVRREHMEPIRVFQSTLPVGGATLSQVVAQGSAGNFNPRSPWGERLKDGGQTRCPVCISIHAPRGGSDCQG